MPESKNPTPPEQSSQEADASGAVAGASPLVIDARELFRGRREIWIEHDGVRYRLRLTRRNKLILQK